MDDKDTRVLELLHQQVDARLDALTAACAQVETKATFLGGAVLASAAFMADSHARFTLWVLGLLAAAFISAVLALRIEAWDDPPDPAQLPALEQLEFERVLGKLIGTKAKAYAANLRLQQRKARALKAALALTFLATALMVSGHIGPGEGVTVADDDDTTTDTDSAIEDDPVLHNPVLKRDGATREK